MFANSRTPRVNGWTMKYRANSIGTRITSTHLGTSPGTIFLK